MIDIATYKAFTPKRMLEVMHHWLYRQAALTTAECTSEYESGCEACRAAQKRKIAELTEERDEAVEIRDQACGDAATFKAERELYRENMLASGKER